MNQYEEVKSLGRGAYAVVRLVRRKADKEKFVIKKFHAAMDEQSARERTEIAQEVKLLAHLSHVNIVKFYDNFVERGIMHIVMEYATGGTLHKRIAMRDGELFDEPTVWEWFVQIVMALKYVHSCNVLHRDLKTQNIMLSGPQQRTIKLGDFGIAKVLGSGRDMAATVVGTPHYLSPELCQGNSYDHKSDVWSLGCVLYEICALEKPFDASNIPGIIFKIMRSQPRPIPKVYSDDLRKLVGLLLQNNPDDRPTVDEIEAMPIVRQHIKRWKATCKRLRAPLPIPSLPGTPVGSMSLPAGSLDSTPSHDFREALKSPTGATPTANKAELAHQQQLLEAHVLGSLEKLRSKADNNIAKHRASVQTKLLNLQQQLESSPAPTQVSGRVWEAMGQVWADAGNFIRAIGAYRRALRSKNATASLGAMEQLGNLAVRFAQKLWQRVKGGEEEEVMREIYSIGNATMLLGMSAPADLKALLKEGHEMELARAVEAGVAAAKSAAAGGTPATPAAGAGATAFSPPRPEVPASSEPVWRRIASLLMEEGVLLLERLCLLGETAERQSLLGSAFKRRAWTGLGMSRKEDLKRAATAYSMAHQLELAETEEDGGTPSPYALLNQVTLLMLAGGGSELLPLVKEAEEWAKIKQINTPANVWLWVQGVDALCLRYLLDDKDIAEEEVAKAYREQFAFGASQRVKGSVMDQFGFMEEVLKGRVAEEKEILEGDAPPGPATPLSPKRGPALLSWLSAILSRVTDLRAKLLPSGVDGADPMASPPKMMESPPRIKTDLPGAAKAVKSMGAVPSPPDTPYRLRTASGGSSLARRTSDQPQKASPMASRQAVDSAPPRTAPPAADPPAGDNPFARRSANPFKRGSGSVPPSPAGTPSPNPFARNSKQPFKPRHSNASDKPKPSKLAPSGVAPSADGSASVGASPAHVSAVVVSTNSSVEEATKPAAVNPFSRGSGNKGHRAISKVQLPASTSASTAVSTPAGAPTRPRGAPRRPPPNKPAPEVIRKQLASLPPDDAVAAVMGPALASEPMLVKAETRSASGRTMLPPVSPSPQRVPMAGFEPPSPLAMPQPGTQEPSKFNTSAATVTSTVPPPLTVEDPTHTVIVKSRSRHCIIL